MTALVQIVLFDAISGMAVDSARCPDYAAEAVACRLARRYSLTPPRSLDGKPGDDGFSWHVSTDTRVILPGATLGKTGRFSMRQPARKALPRWAHGLPAGLIRKAKREGGGDVGAGLCEILLTYTGASVK